MEILSFLREKFRKITIFYQERRFVRDHLIITQLTYELHKKTGTIHRFFAAKLLTGFEFKKEKTERKRATIREISK